MNDRTEAQVRSYLGGVDDVAVAEAAAMGQRVHRATRRLERRRRAAMGAALVAVVALGGVAVWNSGAGRTAVPAGDGGATTTVVASTVPELSPPGPPPVDGWSAIPPGPRGVVTGAQVVWTGTEAIAVGGALSDGGAAGVDAYDPTSQSWRVVSLGVPLMWSIATWTGDEVLIIGWDDRVHNTAAAVLDPVTGEWTVGPQLPVGFKTIPETPHAWTGSEMLVLVGSATFSYDATQGTWRSLAAWPLAQRLDSASVWTGSEWIVWGGEANDPAVSGALGDGAAYDPATDTWRTLSESPLSPRLVGGVWTGSELLVTAGRSSNSDGMMAYADGAAYDPATDTWRPLTDGPAHPGFQMAWDGASLYLFAKGGVTRYEPASDTWVESFAGVSFCHDPISPVWTGDSLILLGCYDGSTGGAMLTPSERT